MDRITGFLQARMDRASTGFASEMRSKRLTVVLGRWLGTAFVICFVTGVFSHLLQDPPGWMVFPTRPVWIYQFTQGLHVTTGIAAIPLLLAKLWSVFPLLLHWPPVQSALHALERASIALFVASSLVQLATGLLNTYKWYPWPFPFRQTHYWLAWVIIGSLALHIAVKLPVIAQHWRPTRTNVTAAEEPPATGKAGAPNRRWFLTAVTATTAFAVVATAGQSFGWLAPANLFAPRRQNTGPQGVPVTRTAAEAQVTRSSADGDWVLTVRTRSGLATFTLAALRSLPQTEHELPVACVEGWSQTARWRGVRIRDLLTAVGAPPESDLRFTSLEKAGNYRLMTMPAVYSQDELTLLALDLNGAPLDLDHGYPARIMAPGRPGVLQTKWVQRMEVL